LVPVDYSECSRVALRYAEDVAVRLGASLDVVHVWDRPSYVSEVLLTTTQPTSGKSLLTMIAENAQHDLEEFLLSARMPDGPIQSGRLLSGDPASALLEELRRGAHDLVIVGTHGRTGLSRALLGSVTEKLVRLSPVPVLSVPDEAARRRRA
jgi:nucleotide-binding universal stress UspA family protein